ncbi:MAG: nitroreductase family protein [Deltaproteobacteria bacterium]|jgi:nitroreductase|nr:nitroreductase family protein [Deltaproteobacteria bacterium]
MGDFLELAARRYSCRQYSGRSVEREKLVKCLEAARLAPSACNSQPWKFVVVDNPQLVPEVAKCTHQLGVNEYLSKAGAFIIVLEDHAVLMPKVACLLDSQYWAKGDLGAASLSICLEAESLGLGTCFAGVFDRAKLGKLLELPVDQRYFLVIAVGYPASEREVRPKIRKPLEDIVRFV